MIKAQVFCAESTNIPSRLIFSIFRAFGALCGLFFICAIREIVRLSAHDEVCGFCY